MQVGSGIVAARGGNYMRVLSFSKPSFKIWPIDFMNRRVLPAIKEMKAQVQKGLLNH